MGYKQIANVFGPLMVDETSGALLVDAGGFVIEADIIDADINAITGTPPANKTLADLWNSITAGGTCSLADVVMNLGGGTSLYGLAQYITGPGPTSLYQLDMNLRGMGAVSLTGLLQGIQGPGCSMGLTDLSSQLRGFGGVDLSTLAGMGPTSLYDIYIQTGNITQGGMYHLGLLTSGAQKTMIVDGMGSNEEVYLGDDTSDMDGYYALRAAACMFARVNANDVFNLHQSGTPHFALHVKEMAGNLASKTDWAALTSPGAETSSFSLGFTAKSHTAVLIVANIDTSVDVKLWGSMDGTAWYPLGDTVQYTANGTYALHVDGEFARYAKVELDAEAGGTNVTVTPDYYGAR